MYSLVLLTALSTGADVTPAPAAVTSAPVVSGCCGVSSGCCGYSLSCSGCYGSSCHGSCHGSIFGSHGGLFSHHRSSCHGSSCCGGYACCGGGYACSGWATSYGSTWGPPIGMPPYTLHGYNQGGMYGWGPPTIWGGVINTNPPTMSVPSNIPPSDKPADMTKPTVPAPGDKKPDETKKTTGMGAILKFRVPADTKLFFDGQQIEVKGTERVFSTPPLPLGQKFFYDVRAELTVNGATVVEDLRVFVEAGSTINESFVERFAVAQGKPAVAVGK